MQQTPHSSVTCRVARIVPAPMSHQITGELRQTILNERLFVALFPIQCSADFRTPNMRNSLAANLDQVLRGHRACKHVVISHEIRGHARYFPIQQHKRQIPLLQFLHAVLIRFR